MKICPNRSKHDENSHREFYAEALIIQEWIIDGGGKYLSIHYPCIRVLRKPQQDMTWKCTTCGSLAVKGKG